MDWLPSVFPAVGSAKRGSQLLAVWQLSCVSDQDHLNKLLFPRPKESPCEI